jgi:hypothetical protein
MNLSVNYILEIMEFEFPAGFPQHKLKYLEHFEEL